ATTLDEVYDDEAPAHTARAAWAATRRSVAAARPLWDSLRDCDVRYRDERAGDKFVADVPKSEALSRVPPSERLPSAGAWRNRAGRPVLGHLRPARIPPHCATSSRRAEAVAPSGRLILLPSRSD